MECCSSYFFFGWGGKSGEQIFFFPICGRGPLESHVIDVVYLQANQSIFGKNTRARSATGNLGLGNKWLKPSKWHQQELGANIRRISTIFNTCLFHPHHLVWRDPMTADICLTIFKDNVGMLSIDSKEPVKKGYKEAREECRDAYQSLLKQTYTWPCFHFRWEKQESRIKLGK